MNTSVIRHRVADFLVRHAPFDSLPEPDLLELAASGRVKFHESEEFIQEHGGTYGPLVWVVQQGQVEILDAQGRLADIKGEGDVIGMERFAAEAGTSPKPRYSARTMSDVILYGVSAAQFAALVEQHPAMRRFVDAHVSVSPASGGFGRSSWLDAPLPPLEFVGRLPGARLREDEAVPVARSYSTREIVRAMVAGGVDRVQVAPGVAMPAGDLAMFCGANPPAMLQLLRSTGLPEDRRVLLDRLSEVALGALSKPADVEDYLCLQSAASLAGAHSVIREAGLAELPERHAFLLFGRAARGELGGVDTAALALVYEGECAVPGASQWAVPGVTWPEGFRSVMTLQECLEFFTVTLQDPLGSDLYQRRALFDCVHAAGDPEILRRLRETVVRELAASEVAILLLANDTLAHLPPLTFFQGVVLDWDGARRETFNIRETALSPIAGAARVFALSAARMDCVATLDRLRLAEELQPERGQLFREAADAFRTALYFQALAGSDEIDPRKLSKLDQQLLKTMFGAIARLLKHTVSRYLSC